MSGRCLTGEEQWAVQRPSDLADSADSSNNGATEFDLGSVVEWVSKDRERGFPGHPLTHRTGPDSAQLDSLSKRRSHQMGSRCTWTEGLSKRVLGQGRGKAKGRKRRQGTRKRSGTQRRWAGNLRRGVVRYCSRILAKGQNEVRPQAARCSLATCGAARFSKWDTLKSFYG